MKTKTLVLVVILSFCFAVIGVLPAEAGGRPGRRQASRAARAERRAVRRIERRIERRHRREYRAQRRAYRRSARRHYRRYYRPAYVRSYVRPIVVERPVVVTESRIAPVSQASTSSLGYSPAGKWSDRDLEKLVIKKAAALRGWDEKRLEATVVERDHRRETGVIEEAKLRLCYTPPATAGGAKPPPAVVLEVELEFGRDGQFEKLEIDD